MTEQYVSDEALDALEQFLTRALEMPLACGEIQVVWAPLPGRTAVTAAVVDGVLLVVMDEATPMSRAHTAEMIADARGWLRDRERIARLRQVSTVVPNPRRPLRLEMVG